MTTPRPAPKPRFDVVTDWDVRIGSRDGVELSANIWRPMPRAHPEQERFPAILEMIPYGKGQLAPRRRRRRRAVLRA